VTWTEAIGVAVGRLPDEAAPERSGVHAAYSSGMPASRQSSTPTRASPECGDRFGFDQKPTSSSGLRHRLDDGAVDADREPPSGGTVVMYEVHQTTEPDRFWEMIDRHGITQFGISPTAIQGAPQASETNGSRTTIDLSPRILGSTG